MKKLFVVVCLCSMLASATVRNVKTGPGCGGAVGSGTTDDTAAINSCISVLAPGDTLLFPAGTYRVSSQLTVNVTGVTIDGSSNTATVLNVGAQQIGFLVGRSGIGNTNAALGPKVALSATANEGASTFTTVSSLGVSVNGYVYLQQGGQDGSNGSGNTACDPSGCRGEVVKVTAVSGNTYTVTTPLHDTFNPSVNAATAQAVSGMLSGVTVQNITFDGNGGPNIGITYGLMLNDLADSTITGVTSKKTRGSALLANVTWNTSFNNIKVTNAGSAACGGAALLELSANAQINTMSLSALNPGAPNTGCLNNGAFGFQMLGAVTLATVTGLTVDSAGTGGGRPMKMTAARYNTFNSLTVKNGCCAYNGLSLEYYSSHNTFKSCVIQNNGGTGTGNGNAGINSFGNFNQFNTFSGCVVSANGNVQILINNFDALRLGQDSNDTFISNTITGISNSSSTQGLLIEASNACVNNNTFTAASGLTPGISVLNSTDIGSGNILNGASSNLTNGTCGTVPPNPPTGLSVIVN